MCGMKSSDPSSRQLHGFQAGHLSHTQAVGQILQDQPGTARLLVEVRTIKGWHGSPGWPQNPAIDFSLVSDPTTLAVRTITFCAAMFAEQPESDAAVESAIHEVTWKRGG